MQILISSLSGVFGVVVGGFVAYSVIVKQFMSEQKLQGSKKDNDLYLKAKREKLYGMLYNFLLMYEKDICWKKDSFMSDETRNLYNTIRIDGILGNNTTMKLFYELKEELPKKIFSCQSFVEAHEKDNEKIQNFYTYIRKELGVKD